MSQIDKLATLTFENGYAPNQPQMGEPNGTFVEGEGVWVRPGGRLQSWKGVELVSANAVAKTAQTLDVTVAGAIQTARAYLPDGNLIRYPGGYIFGISPTASAQVYIDEVAKFQLSSVAGQLTVAIPDGAGNFTALPAALPTPAVPVVANVAGGTKDMAGSVSVRIAQGRSVDGSHSAWTAAVTLTVAAGERVRVTFPAIDGPSMADRWLVAGTRTAAGVKGPWYEVPDAQEVLESSLPGSRQVTFEWRDQELQVLVSTDLVAPDVGRFIFVRDGIIHVVTSAGGNTPDSRVQPLLPLNPTMRIRRAAVSTQNGHTIVGVAGGDEVAYLMCRQSLQVAKPSGLENRPTTIRQIWNFGFTGPQSGLVIDGVFYGFSVKGLARTRADQTPDRNWTRRVDSELRNLSAEFVILGEDPQNTALVVFGVNPVSGVTTAFPFMHRDEVWSAPMTIQGQVRSAAKIGDDLIFVVESPTSTFKAYRWNSGNVVPFGWYLSSPLCDAGNERYDKEIFNVDLTANANRAGLFIAERGQVKPALAGAPLAPRLWNLSGTDAIQATQHLNIAGVAAFAAYVAGDVSNQTCDEFSVYGRMEPITR